MVVHGADALTIKELDLHLEGKKLPSHFSDIISMSLVTSLPENDSDFLFRFTVER